MDWPEESRFDSRQGQEIFLFFAMFRLDMGLTQPLAEWVYWRLSLLGIKQSWA
jgi:hypothetical protein